MGLATNHITSLVHQLKQLTGESIDREVIHELRVIVKRLKALWVIHPVGDEIPFKKSFPHIRKLFRLGARTRDLQVIKHCLLSLPDFPKYPALSERIKHEIKLEKKKLAVKMKTASFRHDVMNELNKFREIYKISSGFILKTNRKNYRSTVEEHMRSINPRDADKLHDLRKMLKNQIYQSEAFNNHHDLPKTHDIAFSLQGLQHQLGNWHDWWNTVEWLSAHKHDDKTPHLELIKQAKTKEAALKRELMRSIRAYLLMRDNQSA